MARCPAAEWRPIAVNYAGGGCHPRLVVIHIMDGTFAGTDGWFRDPAAQVSAHFGTSRAGVLRQWVDTADTAWHAYNANGYAIGIENEGRPPQDLTPTQVTACAKVLAWARKAHGIPIRRATSVWDSGLAYHALGGADWGGHTSCPGPPVVAQLPAIIAAAADLAGQPVLEDTVDQIVLELRGGRATCLGTHGRAAIILHADAGWGTGSAPPSLRVAFGGGGVWQEHKAVAPAWAKPVRLAIPAGALEITVARSDAGDVPVTVEYV